MDREQRAQVIPVADGTVVRQQTRGKAAIAGLFAGLAVGLVLGIVLTEELGRPNPDAASGVEHPPFVLPIGLLGGALVGARRLEVQGVVAR